MVLQNLQNDFKGSNWKHEIDVRDFIQANYEPYDGDESFLTAPSARTTMLWDKLSEMFKVEREKGVYDAETKLPQTLDTYGAGYIDKDNEVIVGLQTDAPLKRGIFPRGGIRMVESALKAYGYELDPATKDIYTKYCKTHNEGVFSAYNDDIKAALASGKVASYVTDFPTEETVNVPGIVALPHLGASTEESEDNCAVMAAKELIDFLETGNIRNSVNYPDVSLPHTGDARICIFHKNIPGVLNNITAIISSQGINVENMINKSKKDYAYTIIEVNGAVPENAADTIASMESVVRVNIIK